MNSATVPSGPLHITSVSFNHMCSVICLLGLNDSMIQLSYLCFIFPSLAKTSSQENNCLQDWKKGKESKQARFTSQTSQQQYPYMNEEHARREWETDGRVQERREAEKVISCHVFKNRYFYDDNKKTKHRRETQTNKKRETCNRGERRKGRHYEGSERVSRLSQA